MGKSAKKLPPLGDSNSLMKAKSYYEHIQPACNMSAKAPARAGTTSVQLISEDEPHPSRIKIKIDEKNDLAVMRMPTHSPKEREHLRTTTNQASPFQSNDDKAVESSVDKVPTTCLGQYGGVTPKSQ